MLIFFLLCVGLFIVFDIRPAPITIKGRIKQIHSEFSKKSYRKRKNTRDIITLVNGTKKESFVAQNINLARKSLDRSGQKDKMRKVMKFSIGTAVCGVCIGLVMGNILLSIVLAIGLYFLPMWLTQFSVYNYEKLVNQELEVALNMITMSYLRQSDIVSAIKLNLDTIKNPVKLAFQDIVMKIELVGIEPVVALEQSKAVLNNNLYNEWCNALILCMANHTLRDTLPPIVEKFAELKSQQEENSTLMMLPLNEAKGMVAIVAATIPGLALINKDWYDCLAHTTVGQIAISLTFVVIFFTLNKAIKLSKPIEYRI